MQKKHLNLRAKYEKKFFYKHKEFRLGKKKFITIKKNTINKNEKLFTRIQKIKPNLIITYGCSILKDKIINQFKKKILNIHLGLSPYYKGSGTNYWPFVNNELQFLGITYMLIDKGIDTGPILHQFRAKIFNEDNAHIVGNRSIKDLVKILKKIIDNFEIIKAVKQKKLKNEKIYKEKDFNDQSLKKLSLNYKKRIIHKYLKRKNKIDKLYPIVNNKFI